MKPGDLIWIRDDMGVFTPAIYVSDAIPGFIGPRIKVLQNGVIFEIGKHRTMIVNEAR